MDYFDEDILPITADHYLYLSGTPFRASATGKFCEFDLNEFFDAEGIGDRARFKHQDEVQKWLDII